MRPDLDGGERRGGRRRSGGAGVDVECASGWTAAAERAALERRDAGGARRTLACGVAAMAVLIGCAQPPDGRDAYRRYAEFAQITGGLRSDIAPADAPYGAADLIRHFEGVVFTPEAFRLDRAASGEIAPLTLKKWRTPIVYRIEGDAAEANDARVMRSLARSLAAATGLAIADGPISGRPNVTINILSHEARGILADRLAEHNADYRDTLLGDWIHTVETPCIALFSFRKTKDAGEIYRADLFIKGELEGVLRDSCLHEEFTQILGLTEDHADIRPSIFNDDQEFALVTRHDRELLRILYDARLTPGMTREEAMPIVRDIVREFRLDD